MKRSLFLFNSNPILTLQFFLAEGLKDELVTLSAIQNRKSFLNQYPNFLAERAKKRTEPN
jgi:hypothetical protein